jgi:hypothetical protein
VQVHGQYYYKWKFIIYVCSKSKIVVKIIIAQNHDMALLVFVSSTGAPSAVFCCCCGIIGEEASGFGVVGLVVSAKRRLSVYPDYYLS